ncbi:MAG TPA: hypothetical protein VGO80_08465 [Solirubrobacteraceae bacterium]|jgi:hypothetical protein|nr:hypothetical protein [Solirubrobacteraceae bacterium]
MSSKIKVVVGVVLVVVLVVIAVSLLTGGDDDTGSTSGPSAEHGDRDGGSEPSLRTVSSKRSQGKNAVAATSGIIEQPQEIWLRVSAAPKQKVAGQWNVSCGAGATDSDTFEVTPPHTMKLRIPGKKAKSCIAGASAQLAGTGRLKLSILRDR